MENNSNLNDKQILLEQSVLKVGKVVAVLGTQVRVEVDKEKNASHLLYNGQLLKNISVGSYIKIIKGFTPIIGKVEEEFVEEDVRNTTTSSQIHRIKRVLSVTLLGFISNQYRYIRGINELPLLDNECYLLTSDEFELIHRFVNNPEDPTLLIGALSSDPLTEIRLGVDSLFSSHIGIFGNTGSGKSYTLAKLYSELFLKYNAMPNFRTKAKFLFFDFNGEYSSDGAVWSEKKVYRINTHTQEGEDKIPLSERSLLSIEILTILANATEKTQRPFINRCIKTYHYMMRDFQLTRKDDLNEFSIYKYSYKYGCDFDLFEIHLKSTLVNILHLSDREKGMLLLSYYKYILPVTLDEFENERNVTEQISFHNTNGYFYFDRGGEAFRNDFNNSDLHLQTYIYELIDNYKKPLDSFEFFIHVMYFQLIQDVLHNYAINEHIAPAINKMKSASKNIRKIFDTSERERDDDELWGGKNIMVIDLNNANTDTKKLLPLIIAKNFYESHKLNRNDNDTYFNLIIDEAHNVLSYQSKRENEDWKDYRLEVFEEIIKEGRKFGAFMTIASQRPSDISGTIISQLHNYFIHRLVNEHDINQVRNSISYLDKVSAAQLPILSTGVCIVTGQQTEMPILVKIHLIKNEYIPNNETIKLVGIWDPHISSANEEQ